MVIGDQHPRSVPKLLATADPATPVAAAVRSLLRDNVLSFSENPAAVSPLDVILSSPWRSIFCAFHAQAEITRPTLIAQRDGMARLGSADEDNAAPLCGCEGTVVYDIRVTCCLSLLRHR
jgi:hypothetical protein